MSNSNRNFGLDLIRALAICLVVFSHATYLVFPNAENLFVTGARTLGAVGVDIFFVLSGFLIGGILLKQIDQDQTRFKDLFTFWKRRWYRTLPNYFLILLINLILLITLGKVVPQSWYLYLPFLQNFYQPHPDFFTEAWSLSIEEYAYLFLPFILFSGFYFTKEKSSQKKWFIGASILAILFGLILKSIYVQDVDVLNYKYWSSTYRKVVVYRMDSIYVGFVLIYFVNEYSNFVTKFKKPMFVIGTFLFFWMHAFVFKWEILPETNTAFYVFVYLQSVSLSIALVFPLIINLPKPTAFLEKTIYFLSTRSYSIYLINYSIVLLNIEEIVKRYHASHFGKAIAVSSFLILTLLLSNTLYSYYEKPILVFRDKRLKM